MDKCIGRTSLRILIHINSLKDTKNANDTFTIFIIFGN